MVVNHIDPHYASFMTSAPAVRRPLPIPCRPFIRPLLTLVLTVAALLSVHSSLYAQVPAALQPIIAVDDVRPGMKGYGLSVFHGSAIETFPVEVVSIMRNFTPGNDVVWIRCPDERMQKSGPVHGMSGSPIYLWADGEAQQVGKGGKLLGAFAFGYETTKDCYVGVQPIAYMRAAGDRAPDEKKLSSMTPASLPAPNIRDLLNLPEFGKLDPARTFRVRAMAKIYDRLSPPNKDAATATAPLTYEVRTPALSGQAKPMMLPLSVGSAEASRVFGPMLQRMGFAATASAGGGMTTGAAPPGMNLDQITFAPGSVLAVPLAWGDADMSASGTVTDVLPDGRVLGFGHAMFGQGDSAVPMATGYIHMVMPSLISSFKLGGSGVIRGTLVRDENSAVVGKAGIFFQSAPVTVTVNMPGQPKRVYKYQVTNHRALTPMLTAMLAMQSAAAEQSQPLESTAHFTGTIRFRGDHKPLTFDSLIPDGGPIEMAYEVFGPLMMLNQNPFTPLDLESADFQLTVEPKRRLVTLVSARLDNNEVAPGDNVNLTLRIQPYGGLAYERRLAFPMPRSLPDGEYAIQVAGAQGFLAATLGSRPHLLNPTNVDEMVDTLQRILSVKADAIYLVLQLPEQGLAIGRQELPRLPSSRRALLATPTSTQATEFAETIQRIEPIDMVVDGDLNFTVSVRKALANDTR